MRVETPSAPANAKHPDESPGQPARRESPAEDADLLARVVKGDHAAFELLHQKFMSPMRALVRGIVRSPADTEDILSEVFTFVWTRAADYRPHLGSPFVWIATIMRRRAIDRIRSRIRRGKLNEALLEECTSDDNEPDAPAALISKELKHEVRAALATLHGTESRAIKLAFFDGLPHSAIATELHVPLGTLKARIRRGMIKLQDSLCAPGGPASENELSTSESIKCKPQVKLGENPNLDQRIVCATSDCVAVLSVTGRIEWMNEVCRGILAQGYLPLSEGANWLGFWKEENSDSRANAAVKLAAKGQASRFSSFSETTSGSGKWWDVAVSPIPGSPGQTGSVLVVFRDITFARQTEMALLGQNEILEQIAIDAPLSQILCELVIKVEEQGQGSCIASILLMNADGRRLRHGAAPSLPDNYNQAIDGLELQPDVGTCCAAAYHGKTIITPDIANDPGWARFRDMALDLGLRAAWSMPIISSTGAVLGTFGTYFRERREPTVLERQAVEILCKTAVFAIEHDRLRSAEIEARRAIRNSEQFLQSVLASTPDCMKVLDLAGSLQWMNVNGQKAMQVCDYASLIGANWTDFWVDGAREKAEAALNAARRGEIGRFNGFRATCAGTPRWWDVTVTAIFDDEGKPCRLLVVSRDITGNDPEDYAL